MRRYWQGIVISLLVLGLAATISFQFISNAQAADDRRDQFCVAVPLAAQAGAQAVVDLAVGEAIKRGEPPAEIERTKAFVEPARDRARELVLEALPTCPQP